MNQRTTSNDSAEPRSGAPLLSVRQLCVSFEAARESWRRRSRVRAVEDVSFDVEGRTTLGIVGESGCGKTSLARAVLRLVDTTRGEVWFDGVNVLSAGSRTLRRLRRDMQIVFQDPMGSLNPRMRVGRIIAEPLEIHRVARGTELRRTVSDLLARVGLRPSDADRYPHEFSGGQRQRIGIARAIALKPRLVICDEPVSALDVSVQAQVINLLSELQRDLGLTYVFIAHNLAVVRHVSDRVAVMYMGRIVELAEVDDLFERPFHPYTHALYSAVPEPDPAVRRERTEIASEVPSALDAPAGCAFHPRCPLATDRCRAERPRLVTALSGKPTHVVACHHAAEVPSALAGPPSRRVRAANLTPGDTSHPGTHDRTAEPA